MQVYLINITWLSWSTAEITMLNSTYTHGFHSHSPLVIADIISSLELTLSVSLITQYRLTFHA